MPEQYETDLLGKYLNEPKQTTAPKKQQTTPSSVFDQTSTAEEKQIEESVYETDLLEKYLDLPDERAIEEKKAVILPEHKPMQMPLQEAQKQGIPEYLAHDYIPYEVIPYRYSHPPELAYMNPFQRQLYEEEMKNRLRLQKGVPRDQMPELGGWKASGLIRGEEKPPLTELVPAILGLFFATDEKEAANILKKTFPNIKTYEDPKLGTIAINPRTGAEVALNLPGLTVSSFLQGLGILAAYSPATALKTVPKIVAGSMGTESAIQQAQETGGGEFNELDVLLSGLGAYAGEKLAPILKEAYYGQVGRFDKKTLQQLNRERELRRIGALEGDEFPALKNIEDFEEAANIIFQATGKRPIVFREQQLMSPYGLSKMRLGAQLKESNYKAMQALEKQNSNLYEITEDVINLVAPPSVTLGAPERFKQAALNAIQKLKDKRKDIAEFKEAITYSDRNFLGDIARLEIIPLKKKIVKLLNSTPEGNSPLRTMLFNVSKALDPPKTGYRFDPFTEEVVKAGGKNRRYLTYKELQEVKKYLNEVMEGTRTNAPTPSMRKYSTEIYHDLVNAMEKASPRYAIANEAFKEFSKPIDILLETVIGRVIKIPDDQLGGISRQIFNPRTNPQEIEVVRRIIEDVDPNAWNDLVRNELDYRVGASLDLIRDQGVANTPYELLKNIFGGRRQRAVLYRSLDPSARANFLALENVLKRASAGRSAGSPTVPFGELMKEWRGSLGFLKDTLLRPLATAQEAGDYSLFARNLKAATDILFDPYWSLPARGMIEELGRDTPAASRAFAQLVADYLAERDEKPEEDIDYQKFLQQVERYVPR